MDCLAALAMTAYQNAACGLHHGVAEERHALYRRHSKLAQRIWQHREGIVDGFTDRYGCKSLVWFEMHATMEGAILREKQIKAGSRTKKIGLIEAMNPDWCDLYLTLI